MNDSPVEKRTSRLAIASMASGIVSLLLLSIVVIDWIDWDFFRTPRYRWFQNIHESLGDWNLLLCAVPVISALVLGWVSTAKINDEKTLRGKPLAFFGIASGGAFVLFFLYMLWVIFLSGYR